MAIFQARSRGLTAARGFTLVELLVVISILGVLAAVVVLNVTRFMNAGVDVAQQVERKHVHTAAGCYLVEGNNIASATTVGPGNKGIVASWLTGDLKYYWIIDTDGSVYARLSSSTLNSLSLDGFTSLPGGWISGEGNFSADGTPSILLADGTWNNFTFQTTATFTSDDGYSMYYRSDSDASDGYILKFDPAQDMFVVHKIVDGVEYAMPNASSENMGTGFSGQHNISVSVSGSNHTINVDGSPVMTFTDSTYGSGTVGLQSSAGSNVNFTSFTVSPP